MKYDNKRFTNKDEKKLTQLKRKREQLDEEYNRLLSTEKSSREKLAELQVEFNQIKNSKILNILNPKKIKQNVRHISSLVLSQQGRKQIYSRTYKREKAINEIKKYKHLLYTEGFIKRALTDLKNIYNETSNRYLKRMAAWEIALWYANKCTTDGATRALPYLHQAKKGEKIEDQLRQIAIVEAECFKRIDKSSKAMQVIHERLQKEDHPDLYLALANITPDIDTKAYWINKTLNKYQLEPIKFSSSYDKYCNGELFMKQTLEVVSHGPKISVILSAYNAKHKIEVAIRSILSQTWKNIELLIVDDCSTDQTLNVIKTYASKDSRIKVLSTEQNSGLYVARNLALQEATGELVIVQDVDDWAHAQKLEIQAKHLLENPQLLANTSEQVQLSKDLQCYRHKTSGKYTFTNTLSLMFRRQPVVDKIGFWDCVRFGADDEFKSRLKNAFGNEAIVDLPTGPLSFQRETLPSWNRTSPFEAYIYLMDARREYIESFSHYHKNARNLHFPITQKERLFPVPELMLPQRKNKKRYFDVIMAADYYHLQDYMTTLIINEIQKNQQLGLTTGLIQMGHYNLNKKRTFNKNIRQMINGHDVQVLVNGEKASCKVLIIRSPKILNDWQQHMPQVKPLTSLIIIDETPEISYNGRRVQNYQFRKCLHHMNGYFGMRGRWYPLNQQIRKNINDYKGEMKGVKLAFEDWLNEHEINEEKYVMRLKDWLI